MSYFVIYNDGWPEDSANASGDAQFETKDEAIAFIEQWIQSGTSRSVDDCLLIEGEKVNIRL